MNTAFTTPTSLMSGLFIYSFTYLFLLVLLLLLLLLGTVEECENNNAKKMFSITLTAVTEVRKHLAAVNIKNMQKDSSSGPSRVQKKPLDSCRQAMGMHSCFPPAR